MHISQLYAIDSMRFSYLGISHVLYNSNRSPSENKGLKTMDSYEKPSNSDPHTEKYWIDPYWLPLSPTPINIPAITPNTIFIQSYLLQFLTKTNISFISINSLKMAKGNFVVKSPLERPIASLDQKLAFAKRCSHGK